jgi:hypothetical protein
MDIDALHSTLLSITVLSEKLRIAREQLLTPERSRSEIGTFLHEVDRDLRIAKATLAGELGFGFCPHCWPPELIAADLDGQINCPACGRTPDAWAA